MTKKKPKAKRRKDVKHYVNNAEFLQAMKDYRKTVVASKKENLPRPQVPDFIGECILSIANKLANKPNFMNYPFRDEMISDGIENCLMYINNFDPSKSNNPFAYFTQIIYFAFVRRIQKEKKHLYTKYRMIEDTLLHDIPEDDHLHITKYGSEYSDEYMHEFIAAFEESKAKKRSKSRKKKTANLEDALEK